jgi:aspartyl protease family protein
MKAADGHYWAQANVNGRWIRFLVDTGASAVALTAADARRLGVDLDGLDYSRPVMTASGQTRAAQIRLDNVTVAGARVEDVDALVVREGLSTSLLGMTYLGRLSRFEATRTALILRP